MRGWLSLLILVGACGAPGVSDDAAQLYMEDTNHRRNVLETALWRPDLPYSRSLLGSYSLDDSGWDLLPLIDTHLTPQELPSDQAAWIALGRRVFFELPMRRDGYLSWVAHHPEVWESVGIVADGNGKVVGLHKYEDSDTTPRVGISCAFCHAGSGIEGKGNRRVDLGLARALYAESVGGAASIPKTWGPGRIDVTDDGVNGPTRIPNLFGVKHASHLNHSGVIEVGSPATLAARFETQYILGHRMEARPPRVLTWALAQYVLSLDAPAPPQVADAPEGRDAFIANCSACHDPQRGYAGGLVPADTLISDPTVATTPDRGTGFYKVPSLRGLHLGGPYLHDGSFASLEDLLSAGHPSGHVLAPQVRTQIIQFLKTL